MKQKSISIFNTSLIVHICTNVSPSMCKQGKMMKGVSELYQQPAQVACYCVAYSE